MKKLILFAVVCCFFSWASAQTLTPVVPEKKMSKKELKALESLAPEPTIYVQSEVLDYGVITKGGDGKRKLLVYNKGAKPLMIKSCTPSCGCTAPICPTEPILPGKSAEIWVEYKNVNNVGSFSKSVTISSNDPVKPLLVITIKGEVKE